MILGGRMRFSVMVLGILIVGSFSTQANGKERFSERLEVCALVLGEILNAPDQGISQELLDRAECVGIIPSTKKLAMGFGATYGRGAFVCRKKDGRGPWGAPAMYRLSGGNFGFQLGGQSADFVLLVMNQRGMRNLLKSKIKLGVDASAAVGPKGRAAGAATDASMGAEILTYSRSRGLFAGISLEGAILKQDNKANRYLYGRKIGAKEILLQDTVETPPAGQKLVTLLNKYSPKNISTESEFSRPLYDSLRTSEIAIFRSFF